jgi:hypothetical protein
VYTVVQCQWRGVERVHAGRMRGCWALLQILSSHSQVTPGGEDSAFGAITGSIIEQINPNGVDSDPMRKVRTPSEAKRWEVHLQVLVLASVSHVGVVRERVSRGVI